MDIRQGLPLLLLACFSIAGCRGEQAEESCIEQLPESCRYVDKTRGFSIKVPPGWGNTNLTGSAIMLLGYLGKHSPDYLGTVVVGSDNLPANMPLQTYYQVNLAKISAEYDDYRELKKGAEKIGSLVAMRLDFSYKAKGDKAKTSGYFMVKGGKGYCIMCSADPKLFDRNQALFAEIARSFRPE
ncbi:MAG TPA: hypothetical protein PK280_02425 [Planctomycetota bacterium]|nr:hypothetical protein [Planctomycetota bacterium]